MPIVWVLRSVAHRKARRVAQLLEEGEHRAAVQHEARFERDEFEERLRVRGAIDQEQNLLRPGMMGEVFIDVR